MNKAQNRNFCWLYLLSVMAMGCGDEVEEIPTAGNSHWLPASVHVGGPFEGDRMRVAFHGEISGPKSELREWWAPIGVITNSSRWDPFSAAPKMPLKEIVQIAFREVAESESTVDAWFVDSILIKNLVGVGPSEQSEEFRDYWVYEITFRPKAVEARRDLDHVAGGLNYVALVLPDGNVIKPESLK